MNKSRCTSDVETEALERKSPALANVRNMLGCPRLVSALLICGAVCSGAFLLMWDQLRSLAAETQALRLEFAVRMRAVEVRIAHQTPPPDTKPPKPPTPNPGNEDTKISRITKE